MATVDTGKRFRIIGGIAIVAFLVMFGLVSFFALRNIAQVETFRARVAAHTVTVNSPGNGRIVELPLRVGDSVLQGEELAVLEMMSSSTSAQGGQRVTVPVMAPISGVVASRSAYEGDVCSAGQPMLTLVDPDDVWIEASIHESRIARVKVGQSARVRIRALKVSLAGRVEEISQATTQALASSTASSQTTVEIPVRIAVDAAGYTLLPGMSAEVHVQVEPRLW